MPLISAFHTYREQRIRVGAVLVWAQKHLGEGELLFVSIEGFTHKYTVHDGRLCRKGKDTTRIPAIIVCEPKALYGITHGRTEEWGALFHSPIIEVWEHTGRFPDHVPARHGLSTQDSTALLAVARKALVQKVITAKARRGVFTGTSSVRTSVSCTSFSKVNTRRSTR